MNAALSSLNNAERDSLARWTVLSGKLSPDGVLNSFEPFEMPPRPAVFRHPFSHPACLAIGQRLTPLEFAGDRYNIAVMYPCFCPFTVFEFASIFNNFISFYPFMSFI